MRGAKARVGVGLLLFAVVAGFYWKITLTRQYDWVWGPDLTQQVLPWFGEQARAFHQGIFPLWDPYMWGGQPLLAQAQPGAAYPLNWLLFALPLRRDGLIQWWALQWYFVLIRFMAVGFCYLLCRDLGRSRTASVLAGTVFGLGGYIGNTGWPQMVNGAVWLPLVFLFLLRAGRGWNLTGNAALSGMFLGLAWLSGHHQAPTFLTLPAAGAWLYFIFRAGRVDWRFVRAAALAMVITGLTGALQILPAYEYGHYAKRWVGAPEALTWNQPVPYAVHANYDLKPFSILGVVFPDLKTDSDPFVGVAALALALLALGMCWRDARVRLLGAVALGGLLYSLGHHSLFQGFLYAALPDLDKARVVSAAVVVFEFGIAVLAAFGLDRLGSPEPSPWPRRVIWAALVFGFFTLALFEAIFFANKWSFTGADTVMLVPFFALALAALLYASSRGALTARQSGVLLLLLALLELGNNVGSVFTARADEKGGMRWLIQMRGNPDIADFLNREPGPLRANVPDDAFAENWGALHGVEMWGGSLASLTTNLTRFDFWKYPSRMLWGVGYTIAAKPPPEGGKAVFYGVSGMNVYQHAGVFPRAWPVHELLQAPNEEAGNRLIQERLADFHHMAFLLEAPPAVAACKTADQVTLREHSVNRVRIDARMACQGMVILSDTFVPGWKAEVDGRPAPIYEVNEAMRGVVVPAGAHTLTMQYRPASVLWGALLTALGVAGALALGRRKSIVAVKQTEDAFAGRA